MVKAISDNPETDEPLLMGVPGRRDTVPSEQHPLNDIPGDILFEEVERFAEDHWLMQELPLLQKAALVLQGDTPLQDIPDITEKETKALRYETEKKWTQPGTLYFTIFVCSVGAVVQGWAQTSANGANLFFPKAFGIGSDSKRDTLLVGLINSGPYISVAFLGAWVSDPINDKLGRRGAIFLGGFLSLVSTIGSSLSQNWPQLLTFRIFLGAGLGINASIVSVYAAECAPASIRGGLAVSWQMWVAFGIFLGFVANVTVYNTGARAWRLQLASPFIPTVPLLILVYICPESPAWYIKCGRYDRAFRSLCALRNTELQAAKELYYTYTQQTAMTSRTKTEASFTGKIIELFTIPRNRRAAVAAYVVMLSQQLCGINIIAFYSSTIFSNAGFSTFSALLASCVFGFVNFAGAFPAVWTMDTLGRRSLLLLTLPFMAVTMLAAGLSFKIPSARPGHFGLLVLSIYLFCLEYSPGMGPVPSAYSAEVFPLSHREIGMSFAVSAANFWASLLSLTFPRLLTALQPLGAFTLYAAGNVLALILVFLFVPETKQRTLEELDSVFAVGSWTFIKYQSAEWLPWVFRRYVLRRRDAELRDMTVRGGYREVGNEEDEEEEDT